MSTISITSVLLKFLLQHLQELIRNKARNGQNCCLLEEAFAMVSALPQRSENTHHVSMIENYPATLEVLGEPIRQVPRSCGLCRVLIRHKCLTVCICLLSPTRGLSKCGRVRLELERPLEVTTVTSSSLRTTASSASPRETATLIHKHIFSRTWWR